MIALTAALATLLSAAPPAGTALSFIQDDYPRALAEARARAVPMVVDVWTPW